MRKTSLVLLERIKDGTNLKSLPKLLQGHRQTRMKLHSHFASGCEVEVVIREEPVMFRHRKIYSLRKLITRYLDAEALASANYVRRDRRL